MIARDKRLLETELCRGISKVKVLKTVYGRSAVISGSFQHRRNLESSLKVCVQTLMTEDRAQRGTSVQTRKLTDRHKRTRGVVTV